MSLTFIVLIGLGLGGVPTEVPLAQEAVQHALAIHRAEYEPQPGLRPVNASYGQVFYVHPFADLDERSLKSVEFMIDSTGLPAIKVTFTAEGAAKFRQLTREHLQRRLIFLVHGRVVMDPVVTAEAKEDFTLIQGQITEADAKALAAAIKHQP